jgi:hypothetical protein
MSCYNFELIQMDEGYLGDSVDATYIIHLEGNKERLNNIYTQINRYPVTKLNYILLNKGYKKCDKQLPKQLPSVDLLHAFLTIFKDAKQKQYDNILILEDDFFYDECIKDKKIHHEINTFLNTNKHKEFMYYLGCTPFLQIPSLSIHNRLLLSGGTHACIYSQPLREDILQKNIYSYFSSKVTPDWDIYCNSFIKQRYMYYKPLCYQLFPTTENSKNWKNDIFNPGCISGYILDGLLLNKQVYPGYNILYIISKIQFIILFLLLCIILKKILMKYF